MELSRERGFYDRLSLHRVLLFLVVSFTWIPKSYCEVETRMETQFKRCCGLGTSWAAEGLRCEKFTGPVSGVPRVEQGLCLEAVDICCVRAFHERSCEMGKKDARAGKACVQGEKSKNSPCPGDQQRDCCEGCKLGILTGSMGQGCAFKSFTFGKPWDPAFLECCHEASPTTTNTDADTSPTPVFSTGTTMSVNETSDPSSASTSSTSESDETFPDIPTPALEDLCQLMKGLLCSDICVPTSGSFYCKCPDDSILLEDGKTCRKKSPEDRCKTKNPCAHVCNDTGSDVICSCNPGFVLGEDGHGCSPVSSRLGEPSEEDNDSYPRCPAGYKYNKTGQVCDDVDECAEGTHSCGREVCYNQPGGYTCARAPKPLPVKPRPTLATEPELPNQHCRPGSKFVRNRGCVDIDECQEDPEACTSNERCVNTPGSFVCQCKIGFRRDDLTQACVDINECQLPENSCLSTQRCDNTLGSYNCVRYLPCGTGYTLNAATEICEDDDECVLGTHDCSGGYHCRNTLGSYRCDRNPRTGQGPRVAASTARMVATTTAAPPTVTPAAPASPAVGSCPRGFASGPRGQCIDVDECQRSPNPCTRAGQNCVNTMGSYRCVPRLRCGNGYSMDPSGSRCVDLDECADGSHQCGSGQICQNRQGGYTCKCPPGHAIGSDKECIDIDECSLYAAENFGGVCGQNSRCENTAGSYRCICDSGFENVATGHGAGVCQDVDECVKTPGLCQHNCHNAWGSYKCSCRSGFRLNSDNRSCSDIDECTEFKKNNLCIGICQNTPGSYACSCPAGYKLGMDERTCQDIDECASGRVCRDPNEMCQNTRGSYRCNKIECPTGYYRDRERMNRCLRTSRFCPSGDLACFRAPAHLSYNFITFVSMIPIPPTGQLELFTMRSTHTPGSTIQFSMALVDARGPPGVPRVTESSFALRRPAPSQAVLVLTESIGGPQEIELDLTMEIYHDTAFAGSAVAKLLIFVSQYEF